MGLMKRNSFLRWKNSATIHASYREESGISGPPRSPRPLKKGTSPATHVRTPSMGISPSRPPRGFTMPKARVWAFLGSIEVIVVRSGTLPIIHR